MEDKALLDLLSRYRKGTASAEDIAFLESWYLQFHKDDPFQITAAELEADGNLIWKAIEKERASVSKRKIKIFQSNWATVGIAAAVAIVVLGVYFFNFRQRAPNEQNTASKLANDVKAGSSKAFLTLADGRRIELTDAKNGALARQPGVRIEKTADGQLVYTMEDDNSSSAPQYNTIETPRGGQHTVNLPDGSLVILNAASSIKFPTNFSMMKDRKVELHGEAYFEIAKDKAHPFIVVSDGQEVTVLGTHFNINAYNDEGSTKTTLLEGSVKVSQPGNDSQSIVSNSVTLKPNHQSILKSNQFNVVSVATEDVVAWKNGNFIFNDESLESIMRKVSRWYDVEVIYQDKLPPMSFIGAISRSKNLSALINILEQSGDVNFKIQGRRIVVMK